MPTTISSSPIIKDQEDRSQAEVDLSRKGEVEVAADCITLVKCAHGRGNDFSFADPQSDNEHTSQENNKLLFHINCIKQIR